MLELNGVTYNVVLQNDTEEMNDTPNLQREMRKNGIVSTLYIQRPRGTRTWMVHQFNNGEYGQLVNIGRI